MADDSDANVVAEYCARVLPLATALLGDEYYYQSLPLCVIDAVFSIGVRYEGGQNVIHRYCQNTQQKKTRERAGVLPPTSEQESISVFCSRPEQANADLMATNFYKNNQRTSAINGILKADAVLRFARCLERCGIQFLQDVPGLADNPQLEKEIRKVPGQRSGISLQYFWMLAGSDDFVKLDRMVRKFLESILSRPVSPGEVVSILKLACRHLQDAHPHITPRLLDHEIWKYQRTRG